MNKYPGFYNLTEQLSKEDLEILKKFQLIPQMRAEHGMDTYLGKHSSPYGSIRLWVCMWPAMFWKFEIFRNDQPGKYVMIETGSGCLTDYWKTAEMIMENLIDVTGIRIKSVTDTNKIKPVTCENCRFWIRNSPDYTYEGICKKDDAVTREHHCCWKLPMDDERKYAKIKPN
jgi:hypothetical protein